MGGNSKKGASSKLDVKGKTVVLTGTMAGIHRDDITRMLTELGARVTGSVSKKTDYVFAAADAGSKKTVAERLGVTVLGESELFALIGTPHVEPHKPAKPPTQEMKAKVAARAPKAGASLSGVTVVITGTLSRPRADVQAMLEAVGAIVHGSVSANTQYLIAGAGVGAAKTSKAAALGVKVIDEATMNSLLGES